VSIKPSAPTEEEVPDFAARRDREAEAPAGEGVRSDLGPAAVSDLDPEQVAETQMALIGELSALPEWKAGSRRDA